MTVVRPHAALVLLLVACSQAPAPPPGPTSAPTPASPPPSASASAAPPTPTPATQASASPAPPSPPPRVELNLRVRKSTPVTCNAKQTNVPCIYNNKGSGCLLRRFNCDGKPCEEGAHEPIACSAAEPSLAKPTRVCLDVLNATGTSIRVFQDESMSHSNYGPVPRDHIRMCANDPADRGWKLDDFGALDWAKNTCFTLDAKARALTAGCSKYDGTIIEGRL